MLDAGFGTPFAEQLAFLRQKLNLPTERWDDIEREAHDRAFMVAGAMKVDLLQDLRQAVDKAVAEGRGIADFRKDFRETVKKHGWTGWTGEGSASGEAWRTKVIYRTNMAASYAAGRWQQLTDPAFVARRPYWRYVHSDLAVNPRVQHQAWNGLTLPHDDPFWQSHFPPNGWGCQCRVVPVDAKAYEKARSAGLAEAPEGWESNAGIDAGWDYAPGASLESARSAIKAKAEALPSVLGEALQDAAQGDPRPVFVEQKTAKACAQWAMANGLADFADYTGVKPEVANAWNKGLFYSLQEFPELRKNQVFTGSAQAQFAHYAKVARAEYAAKHVAAGVPQDVAEKWAQQRIKAPRVEGRAFAQSWTQREAKGVAINAKWGGDPRGLADRLGRLEQSGWFPPGCNTYRSILDHEIGHQLDELLGLAFDKEVVSAYKKAVATGMRDAVSGYAESNNTPIQEFIAECWSESCNNPAPRDAARTVAAIVRARYRSKFPAGSGG